MVSGACWRGLCFVQASVGRNGEGEREGEGGGDGEREGERDVKKSEESKLRRWRRENKDESFVLVNCICIAVTTFSSNSDWVAMVSEYRILCHAC